MLSYLRQILLLVLLLSLFNTAFSQTKEIWGVTSQGGEYNSGVIFKTDSSGLNHTVVHSFKKINCRFRSTQRLVKDSNGIIYGVSTIGGVYKEGNIFSYNSSTKTYKTLYNFNESDKNFKADRPLSGLVEYSSGLFYGSCTQGGVASDGVVYEFNSTSNAITSKFDLNTSLYPIQHVENFVKHPNGYLYSIAFSNRLNVPCIFKYNPSTGIAKVIDSIFVSLNWKIRGTLNLNSNGKFYCMAVKTSNSSWGILEFDPLADTASIKGLKGKFRPYINGFMVASKSGDLYGTTRSGGKYSKGGIAKYDIKGDSSTMLVDFNDTTIGSHGLFGVMQLGSDRLMCLNNESTQGGVLIEYNISKDSVYVRYKYPEKFINSWTINTQNMVVPVLDSNGVLIGTSPDSFFAYDTLQKKFDNNNYEGHYEAGGEPDGGLTLAQNGKLYGIAHAIGTRGQVLYEVDPLKGSYEVKKTLPSKNTIHANKLSNMISATNGKLYGVFMDTTGRSKWSLFCDLFEYDPITDSFRIAVAFNDTLKGTMASTTIFQSTKNGKIYGLAERPRGGARQHGVFEYDFIKDTVITTFLFDTSKAVFYPKTIQEGKNGLFYGFAWGVASGRNTDVIYELNPTTGQASIKHYFDRSKSGYVPTGKMLETYPGVFYGFTEQHAKYWDKYSSIFKFELKNNKYSSLHEFKGTDGRRATGSLMMASNGKIYGAVDNTINFGGGIFLEFDTATANMTILKRFIGNYKIEVFDGTHPIKSHFIEVDDCFPGINRTSSYSCDSAKVKGKWYYQSQIIVDTLKNATSKGCDSLTYHTIQIHNSSSIGKQTKLACDQYTWKVNNKQYFQTGNYRHAFKNSLGCDSLVELDLIINKTSYATLGATACDTFTSPSGWYTYTQSGTYTDTMINSTGCDSIITLNINIKNSTKNITKVNACNSYLWPQTGRTYYNSNVHSVITGTSSNGCNKYEVLDLKINKNTNSLININACRDFTSPSGKFVWKTNGVYYDTIATTAGCDSNIQFTLTFNRVDTSVTQNGNKLQSNSMTAAAFHWLDCNNSFNRVAGANQSSFIPKKTGAYAVEVTDAGCVDTSKCYQVNILGFAKQHSDFDLSLYPNPTTGVVIIDFSSEVRSGELRINNLLGEELSKLRFNNALELNTELIGPSGVYLISVNTNDGNVATFRVFKN